MSVKKPECPLQPPFYLKKAYAGMSVVMDSCDTETMGNRNIWVGTTATARAICYALSLAYPVKKRRKP